MLVSVLKPRGRCGSNVPSPIRKRASTSISVKLVTEARVGREYQRNKKTKNSLLPNAGFSSIIKPNSPQPQSSRQDSNLRMIDRRGEGLGFSSGSSSHGGKEDGSANGPTNSLAKREWTPIYLITGK